MISPLKSSLKDKLCTLFSDSTQFRVATDDEFNILWQSHTKKRGTVIFCDTDTKSPKDGMICRVFVDELCMNAECEVITIDDEKLYMWTIHSAVELVAQVNNISSYKDVTFLFNSLKAAVEELKQWINSNADILPDCDDKIISCNTMTEQIIILDRVCGVMYDRRQEAIEIYRLLSGVVKTCNKFLKRKKHHVSIMTMQPETIDRPLISCEPNMLASALLCIVKRVVCFSGEKDNMLHVSHDEKNVIIDTRYTLLSCADSSITNDFEINSAKLYIELIGGRCLIKGDKNSELIKIKLPLFEQEEEFKSTKTRLSKKELENLAKVILSGV